MIPRDKTDFTKQESSPSDNTKASSSSTTSWTRLKDPRIVRVSRALGGKDRHSKVCTVRGLRDRRVRLSVPTAIQLYDLQDRLGLNQPSKVVDWLLNAAKHEIDELPPLQFPQGTFGHNIDPVMVMASHDFRPSQSGKHGLKTTTSGSTDWVDHMKNFATGKSKEVSGETSEEERQLSLENNNQGVFVSSNNFPFKQNPSSFPPFVRWDPSNLTLSSHIPPRNHGSITPQQELDWHNLNLPPGSHHQLLVYHQTQPYFTPQIGPEFDPKQMNFQSSQLSSSTLSPHVDSTTQPVRPTDFNMTVNLLPSQNNEGS